MSPSHSDIRQPGHLRFSAPYAIVGLLLLCTGLAKLWVLLFYPFPDVVLGFAVELACILIAYELFLGFWNFCSKDKDIVSLFNALTFGLFGFYAFTRWMQGFSNCGCAGIVQIPTFVFIILDFSIFAFFSLSIRKTFRPIMRRWWSELSNASRGRLAAILVFFTAVVILQFPFAASLRNRVFFQSPLRAEVVFVGQLELGQQSTCKVAIENVSQHTASVVGVQKSCVCVGIKNILGVEFLPGQSKNITLNLLPNTVGRLHQRIVVFLDHPDQFRMNIDVVGNVKDRVDERL